jgi:hypothetical protein
MQISNTCEPMEKVGVGIDRGFDAVHNHIVILKDSRFDVASMDKCFDEGIVGPNVGFRET